ncbi:phosphomannose isomerase type II C-terminal cupin domain [Humibacillus xanthopallidus]|uniref:Mannose-6-phosphate isomerase-like protein (Cupin superfamily) n=1 Tax=Humibacillus xanthopallidus TaxID=412689 RepID=A0A543HTX7_9MICO|nr:phosphomannose isomerase type II C-terminal cupin domain [Humibacillus xanthopallidus]TQM61813.1 mannose-6-phosphate isomerase-like protein (cupin superfamily) [Humibacillus xanthopallidus]
MTDQHQGGAAVPAIDLDAHDLRDPVVDAHDHDDELAPAHSPYDYDLGDRNPTEDIFVADRPWGQFQQFVSNEQVTVKIITVHPGHRLSLQKHDHRGEMWQVLDVPIDIIVDDRAWLAQPGETIWVPRGATHRMGNSGERPGRLLEVAFGLFDESDIERLQDDYVR